MNKIILNFLFENKFKWFIIFCVIGILLIIADMVFLHHPYGDNEQWAVAFISCMVGIFPSWCIVEEHVTTEDK